MPLWMDETGAAGDPDLELLRELLTSRASVLAAEDPWAWPEGSLRRAVLDVLPFVRPADAEVRAELVRTLPLVAGLVAMEGSAESAAVLKAETAELVADVPTQDTMERPWTWSVQRRLAWLRDEQKADVGGDPEQPWLDRFAQLPWSRQDELLGPIRRPPIGRKSKYFGLVPPAPRLALPSTLAAAARRTPLMGAVIEVATFLADRPGVWSGARLADDVVRRVVEGTSVTDPELVQVAWRLAVLAEFLCPTAVRVFRSERLDLWQWSADSGSDAGSVLTWWTDVAEAMVRDLPDSVRNPVVRLVYAAYAPGVDETSAEVTAVLATPEGGTAVDRLRDLGVLDGFTLTPIGCQGLLMRWTGWPFEQYVLHPGPWRPDLTTDDLRAWLTAGSRSRLGLEGLDWAVSADPQVFAQQLVDVMLASSAADGALRYGAFGVLGQLGTEVTAVVDSLVGTPYEAYRTMWPIGGRPPTAAENRVLLGDQVAFIEGFLATHDWSKPAKELRATTAMWDWIPEGEYALIDKVRAGQGLTADDAAALRQLITDQLDEARRDLAVASVDDDE